MSDLEVSALGGWDGEGSVRLWCPTCETELRRWDWDEDVPLTVVTEAGLGHECDPLMVRGVEMSRDYEPQIERPPEPSRTYSETFAAAGIAP